MPIPIRCFSCGAVIANKYQLYLRYISLGYTPSEAFAEIEREMNVRLRPCCRSMISNHIDFD